MLPLDMYNLIRKCENGSTKYYIYINNKNTIFGTGNNYNTLVQAIITKNLTHNSFQQTKTNMKDDNIKI